MLRVAKEADPLPRLLHFLDFLERAEGSERPDFHRGAISRSMSRVLLACPIFCTSWIVSVAQ